MIYWISFWIIPCLSSFVTYWGKGGICCFFSLQFNSDLRQMRAFILFWGTQKLTDVSTARESAHFDRYKIWCVTILNCICVQYKKKHLKQNKTRVLTSCSLTQVVNRSNIWLPFKLPDIQPVNWPVNQSTGQSGNQSITSALSKSTSQPISELKHQIQLKYEGLNNSVLTRTVCLCLVSRWASQSVEELCRMFFICVLNLEVI